MGGGLYDDAPNIVHVRNSSMLFEEMHAGRIMVVEFFAGWCGHCQAFGPTWKAVAKASCAAAPAMRIGVVDCVADASVCREFEIQGYPTIRLFAGKTQNRYHPADAFVVTLGTPSQLAVTAAHLPKVFWSTFTD